MHNRPAHLRIALLVLLAVAGAIGGALIAGRTRTAVGPFEATASLRADISGDTVVRLAPLGTLRLDTHDGPFGIDLRAEELRLADARRVVEEPKGLAGLDEQAASDARRAIHGLLLRAGLGALAGALALAALKELSLRSAAVAGISTVLVVGGVAATARITWNDDALAEPRFSGLLTAAPNVIGSVQQVQDRYTAYRGQLSHLIGNVAGLYRATSNLDGFQADDSTVRLLHVSDLHLNPQAFDLISQIRRQFQVDAILDSGDIVDWGSDIEARYTSSIEALRIPYVYVRGNHDSPRTAAEVAAQPNARVLEGETVEVKGLRIWGIGDPRFTPDKEAAGTKEQERQQAVAFADEVGQRVDPSADIVLVHDPAIAGRLDGKVPVVLAGHLHRTIQRRLGDQGTLLLVEGSTGGAGLRTLEGDEPAPLACSVLYFDKLSRRLMAYDRISVGGLGSSKVRIERHVVKGPENEPPGPG